MKLKKLIPYILLCILVSTTAHARPNNDLIKANYLYNHLAFHEAIGYYQKIAPNMSDPDVLAKLGDCYRLTKQPEKAAEWYAKAVVINGCPDEAKLHYAQVLMNLQRYTMAVDMLRQYQKTDPEDRRVANMIISCEKADEMKNSIPSGNIEFLSFNSDRSEFGPALRKGELYYTTDTSITPKIKTDEWTGTPFYQIYSVNCPSPGNCNTQLRSMGSNINTKYHDGPCIFSADGNTMYFTRTSYTKKFLTRSPVPDDNDVVHLEIMVASDYDENKKEYKKINSFAYNSKNYSCAHPAISKDGNMLIFTSDKKDSYGGTDLYMCKRENGGKWSKPVNLGTKINTEGDEMFPYLDQDNTLYFASDGWVGYGGLDIYYAKWNAASGSFSHPVNIGAPINSSDDDMSLVYDNSGVSGYFASNRPAAKSGDNIYAFNNTSIYISLKVVDEVSGEALPGANVTMASANGSKAYMTDEHGRLFTQLYPSAVYNIKVEKVGYDSTVDNMTTTGIIHNDTLRKVLKLRRDFNIRYDVVVLDERTMQPIENPQIVFVSEHGADTMSLLTGAMYSTSLEAGKSYNVYALKDNYYGNEKYISTKGIKPSSGGVVMKDTLLMKKLQVGEVYRIDNIYYDFNKANIRADATASLNRLLELLHRYPQMHIQINSHTDCRGSDAYNLKLSKERAHSVINYLQTKDIALDRLKYRGFGERMPVEKCRKCEECTEDQHQKNRRTEFQIISF